MLNRTRFRRRKNPLARKSRKTRTSRRVRRPYFKKRRIPIMNSLIPKRVFHKFPYYTALNFDTGAVARVPSIYEFRSSLYDPDFSGTGHQPYLRDQWASFYSYYRVHGIKYEIHLTQRGTIPLLITLQRNGYTEGASADPDVNYEHPTVAYRGVLTSAKPCTIRGYMSVPKTEGISRFEFTGDDSYGAAMGSNPSKYSKLTLITQSEVASATADAYVILWLYTELWGVIPQAKS